MNQTYKKTLIALAILLVIALGITTYIVYQNKNAVLEETIEVFSNKPGESPYSDLLGNPVSLEQYLGKVLVVVSWASWSPFSQNDLTMLVELASEYSRDDVIFMAINRKETKEQAARYVQTIPSLEGLVVVLDPRDAFYSAVGGYAMPEVVIYNKRGEIVQHSRGVAQKSEIKTTLETLLNKE